MRPVTQKIKIIVPIICLMIGFGVAVTADTKAIADGIYPLDPGSCLLGPGPTSCAQVNIKSGDIDSDGHKVNLDSECYSYTGTGKNVKPVHISCQDGSRDKAKPVSTGSGSTASNGDCSTINQCSLISTYLQPLIKLLAAVVGVAVVFSIIVGGIQYASSADDPQKVSAAKNRIRNAIIALVTFIFLYALLNFLIPGGLL